MPLSDRRRGGVAALIHSDLLAHYQARNVGWLTARGLMNPSVRASSWVRIATSSRWPLRAVARARLIAKYACDVAHGSSIGPGLRLPHPIGIVIGSGVKIGHDVTIYHQVTLGANRGGYPEIGDDVVIYPGTIVVGGVRIGHGATLGAHCFVVGDVAAHERVPGGTRISGR